MTKKLILVLCLSFTLPFILLSLPSTDKAWPSTEKAWKVEPKVRSWVDATHLVDEALGDQPADYEGGDDGPDPFYYMRGLSPSPGEGHFGDFAVNVWTGDVWDLWQCILLSPPAAQKSKEAILDRYLSRELPFYHQLHKLHPRCFLQ